jgi:hypothetical protein
MRTTIDLPDPLLRHLKSKAALEGTSLKELVSQLIELGLQGAREQPKGPAGRSELPSLSIGQPLRLRRFSNATLAALADD